MKWMIQFEEVVKKYGRIIALKGISFRVGEGVIFGIFGPNGAGKTTTIRIISGILRHDSGKVYVRSKNISYLPEELSLYKEEKVISILKYILSLKRIPQKEWAKELEKWCPLLGIEEFFSRKVRELSKGQKKKVIFAISLLGNPEIIIMDEPFVGLDVEAGEGLRKIVHNMKKEGKTIFFSTHILELAEDICEEVVILKNGSIIEHGRMEDLKKKYSNGCWQIRHKGRINQEIFQGINLRISEDVLEIPEKIPLQEIIEKLGNKAEIIELKKKYPNFKEIYLKILGEHNEGNLHI